MWSANILHHQALCFTAAVFVVATWLPGVPAIPLEEFYPFGYEAGDLGIGDTRDDSSPAITLSRAFPLYGRDNSIIYVSGSNSASINFL